MVWPSRLTRREAKHAFEDALDEALLDPDGNPVLADDAERPLGPAVGSLGDISIASGYVAQASLARAYEAEADAEAPPAERDAPRVRPGEAARLLILYLGAQDHGREALRRMRRAFAAAHHPDRVPQDLRADAVTAMAEVNAAIDRALKALGPAQPR